MPNEEKAWYELVKHNFLTPDRSTDKVLHTVRGRGYAERLSDVLTERLTPDEKEAGFAVYLRPGTKPASVSKRARPATKRAPKRETRRR
jgi:hypothetical protein